METDKTFAKNIRRFCATRLPLLFRLVRVLFNLDFEIGIVFLAQFAQCLHKVFLQFGINLTAISPGFALKDQFLTSANSKPETLASIRNESVWLSRLSPH